VDVIWGNKQSGVVFPSCIGGKGAFLWVKEKEASLLMHEQDECINVSLRKEADI